jgi:phosphoenolpyruvate phosphomutase
MKAIILNSGIGSRLGEFTKDKPKCMVTIKDDITILQYQFDQLKEIGIREIIITTGYKNDLLMEYVSSIAEGLSVSFAHNVDYQKTNYIKSLDLIEDTEDDILLMHGDLVFSSEVIEKLLHCNQSCAVIDRKLSLPEKDFKAYMKEDRIEAIGIDYFGEACVAFQPLYKMQKIDWKLWKDSIHKFCEIGNDNVYAEEAFNCISNTIELIGIDINGLLCNEIDNEEDLNKIRNILAI